jgi:hypothetical protein
MTERESRAFFLGAAVAAALFIGGSMLRDAMLRDALSLDIWHSQPVSKAPYFQGAGTERK